MRELFFDAVVHAPEPLGKRLVLVGGEKVLCMGEREPEPSLPTHRGS
jgi:hypothetical protein